MHVDIDGLTIAYECAGSGPPVVLSTVGEAIHAQVPHSHLVLLRGPGHVSSVEAADNVNAELRRFLRSVQ